MVSSFGDGLSGYHATMECNKSQELEPNAFLVGGHCGSDCDFVLSAVGFWACFNAAERADMVSSQAGRSQSSRMFLVLLNPLEGSDFLNFSKSSIAMI